MRSLFGFVADQQYTAEPRTPESFLSGLRLFEAVASNDSRKVIIIVTVWQRRGPPLDSDDLIIRRLDLVAIDGTGLDSHRRIGRRFELGATINF